jgi:hypothetical protein
MGCTLAAVGLSACSLPATRLAPSETPQAATSTAPIASETSTPPPPDQPALIGPHNLAGLAEHSLEVPAWVESFIWPAAQAALPGETLSPPPDLLLQADTDLYPLALNPLGLGNPLHLALNGGRALAFAPDGSSLVVQDAQRTALFGLDGALLRELPHPAEVYGASYSRDSRYLVLTSASIWQANLYDLASQPAAPPVRLSGFETAAPVYAVEVAPGGESIAWHARATLHLQAVASAEMGARLNFQDFISSLSFAPDGSKLTLEAAGTLYLYNLPDGRELAKIGLSAPVHALDWSPDGRLLAAGYGRSLEIWDGASLAPLISLPAATSISGLVAFSPDGRWIASMRENNFVGVWSVR